MRRERDAQGRVKADMDTVNMLLRREEQSMQDMGHGKCGTHETGCKKGNEYEAEVFRIDRLACRNNSFREKLWTGRYLQTTLMSIGRGECIGTELHTDSDQYIRIEHGTATALVGDREEDMKELCRLYAGDAVFIPAGKWHNIVNAGRGTLKLSSTYAPPYHI